MPTRKLPRTPRKRVSKVTKQAHPCWQDQLHLQPGETLRLVKIVSDGNLMQSDRSDFEILDATGNVTGTACLWEWTNLKPPFRTTHKVEQFDLSGKVVRQESG
jgi:hypothetical protein